MKIQNLLEAEIKVPDTSYREIMTIVASVVFSRILTILDDEEDLQMEMEKVANKIGSRYGPMTLHYDFAPDDGLTRKIKFPLMELPRRYFKSGQSRKAHSLKLTVQIGDEQEPYATVGISSDNSNIRIDVPDDKTLREYAYKPEYIPSLFSKLETTAHHELMHVVQKVVWGKFPKGHVDYHADDMEMDYAKYYSHDEEFSPLIYTELGDLRALESIIETRRGTKLTNIERKELFRATVDPNAPPNELGASLSDFYSHLYTHSRPKWKKAVRELYGLFLNRD